MWGTLVLNSLKTVSADALVLPVKDSTVAQTV